MMKKLVGILALVTVFAFSQTTMAQNVKFGHINSDELFQIMPERDTVMSQLQALQTELSNTLEIMQVEYNNKLNDYTQQQETLSEIVRKTKEEELIQLQQRMGNFQQNADAQMQQSQMELMQPLIEKVEKAIKDVGREGGYLYIFDLARGPIIYFDEKKSDDIIDMVKAKLGIQ